MQGLYTTLLLLSALAATSGLPMDESETTQFNLYNNEPTKSPEEADDVDGEIDLELIVQKQQEQLEYLYELFHSQFTNDQPQPNSTKGQPLARMSGCTPDGGTTSSGIVYIRWGRDECPSSSTKVYSGLAAGSRLSDTGGGADYLCLPENPIYDRPQSGTQDRTSGLRGVEYRTDFPPLVSHDNQDVPCAVCQSNSRSNVLMVPARTSCPSGWTREYYGFLMAERGTHQRTQHVCLDSHPTHRTGSAGPAETLATMQPVEGICSETGGGGLPCGPYVTGYELTCAVCTK